MGRVSPAKAPVVAIFPEFEIKSLREIEEVTDGTFLFIKELGLSWKLKLVLTQVSLTKIYKPRMYQSQDLIGKGKKS